MTEFLHPDRFRYYEAQGTQLGFRYLVAGPVVRSSYRASEFSWKRCSGAKVLSQDHGPQHPPEIVMYTYDGNGYR